MRVALVGEPRSVHVQRWSSALLRSGVDLTVVSFGDEQISGVPQRCAPWPASLLRLDTGVLDALRPLWLRSTLEELAPDVVHVHYLGRVHATAMSGYASAPLIVSLWGGDVIPMSRRPDSAGLADCKVRVLRSAVEVHCTSRFLAREARSLLDRPMRVIPFGVETSVFRYAEPNWASPRIVFTKHLSTLYGLDVLLRAVARMDNKDAVLDVAGDGDLRSWQKVASRLGVADRVSFVGQLAHEDLPGFMAGAVVAAMPTAVPEAFGVAALEAQACGIPVVASNVGGIPEVVVDGVTGVLFPPGRDDILAQALDRLTSNPGVRESMSERARSWVEENYEWDKCVGEVKEAYLRVCECTDTRPS